MEQLETELNKLKERKRKTKQTKPEEVNWSIKVWRTWKEWIIDN